MLCVDDSLVLRYLIPFYFNRPDGEGDYEGLYGSMQALPRWQLCDRTPPDSSVHAHLYQALYGTPTDASIGSTWQYDLQNKPPVLLYTAGEDAAPTRWKIREVQLHLFHTNVGLLWYELTPATKKTALELDDLILLQNRFKECNRTHLHFSIMQPRHSKEEETVFTPFDGAVWASELLAPLGVGVHYLNGTCLKNGKECPSAALIYNYVLLQGEAVSKPDLQTAAFRLANGYSRKYRPSPEALDETIHPFEDVCLYASRGGCGYYACVNEDNRAFFTGNFNDNIRKEYFFLYTLVLYQSYSLMNFTRQSIREYSSDPSHYSTVSDSGSRLDRFVAEFNTFLMKGIHSSVSSVHHHNRFYNYLRERLLVEKDIESIRTGTEFLVDLQHIRQDKEEAQQREEAAEIQARRDKRLNLALAILSILSLLAVFGDLDDLFEKLRTLDFTALWQSICSGSLWPIAELIAYAVIVAAGVACVVILVASFLPEKKKKRRK